MTALGHQEKFQEGNEDSGQCLRKREKLIGVGGKSDETMVKEGRECGMFRKL